MKYAIACSILLNFAAVTLAQTAPTAATAPAFSIDTPIEQLVANPGSKAVLDADFPEVATHPAYEQFKAMSLKQLAPYSNGIITDEKLAKASADLAAVK
jgi:hypothetical protein